MPYAPAPGCERQTAREGGTQSHVPRVMMKPDCHRRSQHPFPTRRSSDLKCYRPKRIPRRIQMLQKLRQRAEDEKGFTLDGKSIRLKFSHLITAFALPTLKEQRSKAQDASAKSNARNMVSHMESCYANTQD